MQSTAERAPRASRRSGRMIGGVWGMHSSMSIIDGYESYWFCGYLFLVTVAIVYWLKTREGSILIICYYTSVIFRSWWMVVILLNIEMMNYFGEVIELADSQRMVHCIFQPGRNKLFWASGKLYVLGERMYAMSLYRMTCESTAVANWYCWPGDLAIFI